MKKILLILSAVLFSLSVSAQVFTNKRVLDKFDDVTYRGDIKTLIVKTDSTFVIEEKGKKPSVYMIENYIDELAKGDKDNIVNILDNLYGYEESWYVIREEDYSDYQDMYYSCSEEEDINKRREMLMDMINKYCYIVVHRVITTQITHEYVSELYWIQKGDNNGRTIYSR